MIGPNTEYVGSSAFVLGDSSTEGSGTPFAEHLLASPTNGLAQLKAKSGPLAPLSDTDLIVLINRAELAGFRHYASALKAALPKRPQIDAVPHPMGGYTHAIPHGNGTCRIYKGWWSTKAKAIAALPKDPAFPHLNPQST